MTLGATLVLASLAKTLRYSLGKPTWFFLWALGLHKWLSISRWPKDLHAALVRPLEFDQNGSMQNETFMLLYFYQH